MKLAIVGANGFVGSRAVEWFHLTNKAEVIPIVRRIPALARLARFSLDARIANACNIDDLSKAMEGADVVVHAVVEDPKVIELAAASLLPAAAKVGVRRVIYLSSAAVHGNDALDDETIQLSDRQELAYNNAKVHAERTLLAHREHFPVELVILRPSIVFGPRDRWVSSLASEIIAGTAWLVNEGKGFCNTIYIDNLMHAIELAASHPTADRKAFLLGDRETLTWADFYKGVALNLNIKFNSIHQIGLPTFPPPGLFQKFQQLRASPLTQKLLPYIPGKWKELAKGAVFGAVEAAKPPASPPWTLDEPAGPSPTLEMVLLQSCVHSLSWKRANLEMGYEPIISFEEGMRRTFAWMEWTRS